MPREKKYETEADKQAAYRARKKAVEWTGQRVKWDVMDLHRAVSKAAAAGDELAAQVIGTDCRETLENLTKHFEDTSGPRLTSLTRL